MKSYCMIFKKEEMQSDEGLYTILIGGEMKSYIPDSKVHESARERKE